MLASAVRVESAAHLSNVGAFPAHVWPGDDLEPCVAPLHVAVVLDKVNSVLRLHTRVTASAQQELGVRRTGSLKHKKEAAVRIECFSRHV